MARFLEHKSLLQGLAALAGALALLFVFISEGWRAGSLQTRSTKVSVSISVTDRRGPSKPGPAIPRILHYIYITDNSSAVFPPENHRHWVESCEFQHNYTGWERRVWDRATADAFVSENFPHLVDLYRHDLTPVQKSDVLRMMIMHELGGLYLDSDINCLREGSDLLGGCDVVIQGYHDYIGATNAAMASRPGVDMWLRALEEMQRRRKGKRYNRMEFETLSMTGPLLLSDLLDSMGFQRDEQGLYKSRYILNGVEYCIHRRGTWYQPCLYRDGPCLKRLYDDLANGQVDLRRVAGIHRHSGSWRPGAKPDDGNIRRNWQQQQQQHE